MTTFLEFIRKVPALSKDEGLEREHWNLVVGEHLGGLYRKLYEKAQPYLRASDIQNIDAQVKGTLAVHVAYDWVFNDGRLVHASVLAVEGQPVCAWRKQNRGNDLEALMLLDLDLCARLARWVHELVGRHVSAPSRNTYIDASAWLWEGNEDLAPAGNDDSFFYTVLHPEALDPVVQVVTERSYVPSLEGGLLPIYGLGAVHEMKSSIHGSRGLAGIAHTLNGPRSVDVRNLVHSVFAEEHVRGQDLEALQKTLALQDSWFIASIAEHGCGWTCVVGVHRHARVYLQWHVLHWGVEHRHKMVEWSHRLGEHQAGVLDANVIAAMGWQQGE